MNNIYILRIWKFFRSFLPHTNCPICEFPVNATTDECPNCSGKLKC